MILSDKLQILMTAPCFTVTRGLSTPHDVVRNKIMKVDCLILSVLKVENPNKVVLAGQKKKTFQNYSMFLKTFGNEHF